MFALDPLSSMVVVLKQINNYIALEPVKISEKIDGTLYEQDVWRKRKVQQGCSKTSKFFGTPKDASMFHTPTVKTTYWFK